MTQTLLNYWMLFMALQTPYPYYGILAILLLIFVFCAIFLKIKNGAFGIFILLCTIVGLVFGFFLVEPIGTTTPDIQPDNNTHRVAFITKRGIHLTTGDIIVPAGVTFVTKPMRQYRKMLQELRNVINNDPVTLEWSEEMNGYTVKTSSGVDVGLHMVSKGLATTSSLASDELRNAERAAKHDLCGVWQIEARGTPSVTWYIFPFLEGLASILLGVLSSFLVGYAFMFVMLMFFGRIRYEE